MILVQRDEGRKGWRVFRNPVKTFVCYSASRLADCLNEVEESPLFTAGCFTYESSLFFDKAMVCRTVDREHSFPPVLLGLFRECEFFTGLEDADRCVFNARDEGYADGPWTSEWNYSQYNKAYESVRSSLAAGDSYQINLTFRRYSSFSGNSWQYFRDLFDDQPVPHAAYLRWNEFSICSFSPELFFRKEGTSVTMKPMKGTAPAGSTEEETELNRQWLEESVKNRAENRMITDMIRNDLGKISRNVRTDKLFETEVYRKVIQMTSTVKAECTRGLGDLMRAVFPCASITGAPKINSMKIITEVEDSPRSVYCGSLGWWSPDGDAEFNVAIRTRLINHETGQSEYGTGGGVVWDSTCEDEYRECFHKAAFMDRHGQSFRLLESLLLEEGRFFLTGEHIQRMRDAAEFFGMNVDWPEIRKALAEAAEKHPVDAWKVRLTAGISGQIETDIQPLVVLPEPVRLLPGFCRIKSANPFLRYKTNQRYMYDQARKGLGNDEDRLLMNEKGEITEATSSNIVILKNGEKLTPCLSCGLLAGTFRNHLIQLGKIQEAVLYEEDLESAEKIWLINSVRQWRRAVFRS